MLRRFDEKNRAEGATISIYSKTDSSYEPHFELLFQNTTYPTLPGVYSAFTAIGWFLKLIKRTRSTYLGVDYSEVVREVLCLDSEN